MSVKMMKTHSAPSYCQQSQHILGVHDIYAAKQLQQQPSRFKQQATLDPLVLCGPSGTGKSTLINMLKNDFGDLFGFSVSHTTRCPRKGEQNGKDYHFVTREMMEAYKQCGHFIEMVEFANGHLYGTSKKAVQDVQKQGKICLIDVDIKGVEHLKESTDLNPRCIFIQPPSLAELEKRLRFRGTEDETSIRQRLARAQEELKWTEKQHLWDAIIINDDLESTYLMLKQLLQDCYGLKIKPVA